MQSRHGTISLYILLFIVFNFKAVEYILDISTRVFLYQQLCLQHGLPLETCDQQKHHQEGNMTSLKSEDENQFQTKATAYLLGFRVLSDIPSIPLSIFAGSWSQKVGRKPVIMLPMAGAILCAAFVSMGTIHQSLSIAWIFIGEIFFGLSGVTNVFSFATATYVTDISSDSNRTAFLSKMLASNYLGISVGTLLSGVMLRYLSFLTIFTIVLLVCLAQLCLLVIAVQESLHLEDKKPPCLQLLVPCINLESTTFGLLDSAKALLKLRPNRKMIIFLYATFCLFQLARQGEQDAILLYVEHSPLNWKGHLYGYYLGVMYVSMAICLLVVLPIINRLYPLRDTTLIMIGMSSKITHLILLIFAKQTWLVFVSVVMGGFYGYVLLATRSMLSKLVEAQEIGQVFAFLAVSELSFQLVAQFLFSALYSATVQFFPGTMFVAECVLHLFFWIIYVRLCFV